MAVARVLLGHEGGYANRAAELGGETKYGISKRWYPHLDIKSLTEEDALKIYYEDWWTKYNYDKIDDLELAAKVMDLSINVGPEPAGKFLQTALNETGRHDLEVDGIVGSKTLEAANQHSDTQEIVDSISSQAGSYYQGIVEARPDQEENIAGWMNRASASNFFESDTEIASAADPSATGGFPAVFEEAPAVEEGRGEGGGGEERSPSPFRQFLEWIGLS